MISSCAISYLVHFVKYEARCPTHLVRSGRDKRAAYIVVITVEAASVFIDSWKKAGNPTGFKIVTVGKGTSKPLIENGLIPAFEPSDSTAVTLAAELPETLGKRVLYPSSALADNKLVSGLQSRDFAVLLTSIDQLHKTS